MLATIPRIIGDLKRGRMVIVVDDESRENEGDLICAAEYASPEAINFMARFGRGLICVSMEGKRLDALGLHPMISMVDSSDTLRTAWAISVDAQGTSTGISAYDRAHTVKMLIDETAKPSMFKRPGHIFPLRAREGGVLVRSGHTEASVDLVRLAGLYPAAVICEIMNDDGTMARLKDVLTFAKAHAINVCSIQDLIEYRRRSEKMITHILTTQLPTEYGAFTLRVYESNVDQKQHLALIKGKLKGNDPVLVRVHSECLTGDVFLSQRCDCGTQLHAAMEMIQREGKGVILYMRQEGRGIGLLNKLKAYCLQDKGLDTVQANEALGFKPDLREYGTGAQILADLGIKRIRLLTNNPQKIIGLKGHGLEVIERMPVEIQPHKKNRQYLHAKKKKLGHLLAYIK